MLQREAFSCAAAVRPVNAVRVPPSQVIALPLRSAFPKDLPDGDLPLHPMDSVAIRKPNVHGDGSGGGGGHSGSLNTKEVRSLWSVMNALLSLCALTIPSDGGVYDGLRRPGARARLLRGAECRAAARDSRAGVGAGVERVQRAF